jgi:hypothetical protein
MRRYIKLLSEYFYPEPTATGKLMAQLAEELIKKGFTVEVYTHRPHLWVVSKSQTQNFIFYYLTI